jgi:hypothetical protein
MHDESRRARCHARWALALLACGPCALAVGGEAAGAGAPATVIATVPRSQPMLANVTDAYEVVHLWPRSEAFTACREALARRCTDLEFDETPLREVVAAVAAKAGVPIVLDHESLAAIGFDPDAAVTVRLTGRSFRSGLRDVLGDVDLACVFRNEQLVVTTRDAASREFEKVFYPVVAGVDAGEVAGLIEATIAVESWSTVGGNGTVMLAPAGLGHGLIVAQTAEVHEEIEALLRGLDEAVWGDRSAGDGMTAFVRVYEVEDDDVRDGLLEHLVGLCNDALPHGDDPDAHVFVVGRSIVIQSPSRPFHVMAAQILAAAGVEEAYEVEAEVVDADAPHGT